jgi:hypothetical protein
VLIATLSLEAAATVVLVLTHSFVLLLLAVTLTEVGGQSSRSARGPLIAQIGGPEGSVRCPAMHRPADAMTAGAGGWPWSTGPISPSPPSTR